MNLSQRDFAKVVGVSYVTVARWEVDKSVPSPLAEEKLQKIASELASKESGSPSRIRTYNQRVKSYQGIPGAIFNWPTRDTVYMWYLNADGIGDSWTLLRFVY